MAREIGLWRAEMFDRDDRAGEVGFEGDAGVVSRLETTLDDLAERFEQRDWIELVATVVLSLAVLVAAWSAYQSTRWSGEQAKAANTFTSTLTQWTDITTQVTAQLVADNQALAAWITMAVDGNRRGMEAIEERVSPTLRPALDAWVGSAPPGEIPPGTPFDTPEYEESTGQILEARDALFEEAFDSAAAAADANQTSDNFVLVTVVMAAAMFFAGVGTKLRGTTVRAVMLGAALVLFVGGATVVALLPQNVGF
jgi:hypothetical protein